MKKQRIVSLIGTVALGAALLTGCSAGSSAQKDDNVLTLWDYEADNSAMGIAWNEAIKTFEKETGAKVEFQAKSFEQIRKTASQSLNSDKAPDLMEYNKGNATAGLLASQGLLTPLDAAVKKYGWDTKLAPSLQTTAKYDSKGIMGSGKYYGIPDYGEYVEFYYNKDMFKKYGLKVPTTTAELEDVMAAFKAKGITPLAEAAAEYPLGQLWYQLALSKADRSWVDDYQLYKKPVDFSGPQLSYASDTISDWTKKGYISKDATGMKAEDAGVGFIKGTYPMFFSGSWWYGRFIDEDKSNWGTFLYPGSTMSPGSSGNIWVVPTNANSKSLAYKFIDITLRPKFQALIGNNGGVPVAADTADITDPKSKELIANFNTLVGRDGLGFYPDWPTSTFYDQINAGLQEIVNGSKTPSAVNDELGTEYEQGVSAVTG
jgi:raffinose/stachyose/melibiose transport system substrate-binding protein